ncbi:6974_t:CDS:1 [Funneliformis mosseae]|uniref:6974_t:CDS:1 n=1 Tax=Funneliformis mosseae TaxID=27381 RepID=A0A9N9EI02_FUNMO|nr:6974_t:CDS:1 [Funneliformis mosseae]
MRFRMDVPAQILNTLITCLPNESKDLLNKNGIIIATTAWKPSLFNYASYCKFLSIREIYLMIRYALETRQLITSQFLDFDEYLLLQEMLKMFMRQISSLKSLDYYVGISRIIKLPFTSFPGAKDCMTNLSILSCDSNICSEFFYQLSQICHNVQTLTIIIENIVSNGLTDLISMQRNLKHVTLIAAYGSEKGWVRLITSLSKIPLNLTKLEIFGIDAKIPLICLNTFIHLRQLTLSFDDTNAFIDFHNLQHVKYPQLRILKFQYAFPKVEMLIKFLEINGKDLTQLYVGCHDNLLNLTVAKLCPNLKKFCSRFMRNELETLMTVFNGCQSLESLKLKCGAGNLKESEMLDVVSKYSPKNFHELKIDNDTESELSPVELESFFINWMDRTPHQPISFILVGDRFISSYRNMEVIENYVRLGVVKKFGTEMYDES